MDRLEELKLQNMKSVVQAMRAELAEYWDKCFYSHEQRKGFSPYYDGGCRLFPLAPLWELQAACWQTSCRGGLPSAREAWGPPEALPSERAVVSSPEDYTETVLELHDAEVGRMKSYYETHKDLFEAVQRWEENWKRFLDLEVLSGQEHALHGPVLGHWAVRTSDPVCKVLLGKTREARGKPQWVGEGMGCCI